MQQALQPPAEVYLEIRSRSGFRLARAFGSMRVFGMWVWRMVVVMVMIMPMVMMMVVILRL